MKSETNETIEPTTKTTTETSTRAGERSPANSRPRRQRTSRKRTRFSRYPRPAIAVRGLWEQASDEEKATAHRYCIAILEYWLGKASKAQVASRLEMPALRVWLLSQQALSGMLAGILRQPKRRSGATLAPSSPEEDPKCLRGRIVELEKKLARTEDLVRVLKDLPWAGRVEKEKEDGHARKRGARTKGRRGVLASQGASTPGRKSPRGGSDRSVDGRARTSTGPDAQDAAHVEA
jgi:hypothetical protein